MTLKIELSDAVETASGKALAIHKGYDEGWWDRIPPDSGLDLKYKTLAKIAITAALEAMVKEGTAKVETSIACGRKPYPVLIIHLSSYEGVGEKP